METETLDQIKARLTEIIGERLDVWLTTGHPMLEGDTPASRIERGDAADVLQVLEALATGAYV